MAKKEATENGVKGLEKPVSEAEEKLIYPRKTVTSVTAPAPLGPTGFLVRLRRFLEENGRDMGLCTVCDKIREWPLPSELRTDDLPHQVLILKRLIRTSKYWKKRLDFGVAGKVLRIAE